MPRHSTLFALTAALAASVSLPAHADMMFNRIASFAVADNLPADIEKTTPTSSEIITASEDGMTLVYSDSPLGAVGFIDITDPKAPKAGGIVKIDGEPTSVTVAGGKVLAGVNTSESKAKPSGNLTVIDLATKKIEASCDLGGQPELGRAQRRQELPRHRHRERARRGRERRRHPADAVRQPEDRADRRRRAGLRRHQDGRADRPRRSRS